MRNETEFRGLVAKNLAMYRKANGLTQLELAEKLNYSDKAISKWERGESLPDLYVLQIIANMFGITLNDLTTEATEPKKNPNKFNKNIIMLLSVGLTWLIAVISFVILSMAKLPMIYMPFIYALPISCITLIVFTKMWGYRKLLFVSLSLLYFTTALTVCMQIKWTHNSYELFFIAAALQVLTIFWFFRKKQIK